jgi:hypothetical protein
VKQTPIHLEASPTLIVEREIVTVKWSGAWSPNYTDFIAAFSPPSALDNETTIAMQQVNVSSSWASGMGMLEFPMLNMRLPYQFRYCRVFNKTVYCNGSSNIVEVKGEQPLQGHLALTGNPSEMRVMWVSNTTEGPTVQYGLESGNYLWSQSANSTTYSMKDLCWNTTGGQLSRIYYRDPGWIHNAVMTDLRPYTKYYYRYGSDLAWSSEFSFTSAQVEAGPDGINIIAFGDSGVGECDDMFGWCETPSLNTSWRIMSDIQESTYDMLLHIGDLSYALGYAVRWEEFMYQFEPIATQLPYMVAIGNHEYDYIGQPFAPEWSNYNQDSGGECGVPYNMRYMMPTNGNQSNWYSLDYPLMHLTVFSTEHDFTIGSEQYKWIEQDLKSVNHSSQWLVVTGHRPMYSSMDYAASELTMENHIRLNLEPLFVKYGVDVAFWGHMHCYERTCPVINGICQGTPEKPGAPIHFIIGMAGRALMDTWTSPLPDWSIVQTADFGYTRIHIPDRSTFHLEFVLNSNGTIYDDVRIHYNPERYANIE